MFNRNHIIVSLQELKTLIRELHVIGDLKNCDIKEIALTYIQNIESILAAEHTPLTYYPLEQYLLEKEEYNVIAQLSFVSEKDDEDDFSYSYDQELSNVAEVPDVD